MRKGPLNSYVDPTEFGAGSAILEVSEAVKNSGRYDAWAEDKGEEEIKDGLETVKKANIRVRSC
jgi:nucleolar protein 53